MSNYGFQIRNAANQLVFDSGERVLQYWGKVTVTSPATTSDGGFSTSTYFPFNIPSNKGCSMFIRCKSNYDADYMCIPNVDVTSGKWRISLNAASKQGTVKPSKVWEIYVFVDSSLIPLPDYGLVLYNSDNSVQFSSLRPMLQLSDIKSCSINGSGQSAAITSPTYTSTKRAMLVPRQNSIGIIISIDIFVPITNFAYASCFANGGGSMYGMLDFRLIGGISWAQHGSGYSVLTINDTRRLNQPVIDCSRYDTVPNL